MNNYTDAITSIIILYIAYKIIRTIIKTIKRKTKNYDNYSQKDNFKTGYNHIDNKPYKPKKLLTNNELSFYSVLKTITDNYNLYIFPKVGLKDIFELTSTNNFHWFGRIAQKHIDFIICNNNLNLLFAIELDDKSHNKKSTQKGDNIKNDIFAMNHIKLYRIKAQMNYTKEYILKYINFDDFKNEI